MTWVVERKKAVFMLFHIMIEQNRNQLSISYMIPQQISWQIDDPLMMKSRL
ncbi:Uncharacterised protein [Yersinia enterocolitica]|nr:Uncharacterised protein [Yersinia enterocolitica]